MCHLAPCNQLKTWVDWEGAVQFCVHQILLLLYLFQNAQWTRLSVDIVTDIFLSLYLVWTLSCSAEILRCFSRRSLPSAPSAASISSVYLRLLLVFPELYCAGHVWSLAPLRPSCARSPSPPACVCVCVWGFLRLVLRCCAEPSECISVLRDGKWICASVSCCGKPRRLSVCLSVMCMFRERWCISLVAAVLVCWFWDCDRCRCCGVILVMVMLRQVILLELFSMSD